MLQTSLTITISMFLLLSWKVKLIGIISYILNGDELLWFSITVLPHITLCFQTINALASI